MRVTQPFRGIKLMTAAGIVTLSLLGAACSNGSGSVTSPVTAEVADSSSEQATPLPDPAAFMLPEASATAVAESKTNGGAGMGATGTLLPRGVLPASIGPEDSLLKVRLLDVDGSRVAFKNGGAIRLDDGLIAEIFVDPYPTDTLTAWIDLYLTDEGGAPVTDARVVIDYDMYSMAHGPFFSLAEKSPNGRYLFRLDYIMFGPWGQLLQVKPRDSDEEYRLEVVLVAVP